MQVTYTQNIDLHIRGIKVLHIKGLSSFVLVLLTFLREFP